MDKSPLEISKGYTNVAGFYWRKPFECTAGDFFQALYSP
jgi:hypothetical protein